MTALALDPDVHNRDVGSRNPGDGDSLRAVTCLTHDGETWLGVDDHGEAAPEERLVIDEDNPHRLVTLAHLDACGFVACRQKPSRPPGTCLCGPATRSPPKLTTLSRNPTRP